MNTEDRIKTAAAALSALSPEDRAKALDLAQSRNVPARAGFYFVVFDGRPVDVALVRPGLLDGAQTRALKAHSFGGGSDLLPVDHEAFHNWGPEIPAWDPVAHEGYELAWLKRSNYHVMITREDWHALCEAFGMFPGCSTEDLTKRVNELRLEICDAKTRLASWCPEADPARCSLSSTVDLLINDVLLPAAEDESEEQDESAFWSDMAKARAEVSAWPAWKQAAAGGVLDELRESEAPPRVPCCVGLWWCSGSDAPLKIERRVGALGYAFDGDSFDVVSPYSKSWRGPCLAPGEAWGEGVWAERMADAEKYET